MTSALASFAVLIAVVLSIPLVLWLVKRLSQWPGNTTAGPLSVPASIMVGPRERIAVVKAGERLLLVGITAQSIQLLTELEGDAIEWPETPKPQGFEQLLKRLQQRQNPGP